MTSHRYEGPGGPGCSLERFRARLITYGLGALGLASFAIAFLIILSSPGDIP